MALVTPGTTQQQGKVYGMHFVYSGNFLAQAELSQKYLRAAAEMAVEMNCEEIFIADLIQEANISLLMALGEEGAARKDENWLLGRIRAGIRNAIVMSETPERIAERLPHFFDKILVDAPCSGEGMFRKEPDMVKSWNQRYVSSQRVTMMKVLSSA